jgi:ribosomal protein S18 acetylase RimI-like enzyme
MYIESITNKYFTTNDLDRFINIIYNNFINLTKYPSLNHTKISIIELLTSDSFYGNLIYDDNNIIIGYLLGEYKFYDNKNVYFINYIYIAKPFRNMKYGKLLIEKTKEMMNKNKLDGILLICDLQNKYNVNFYNKLGFVLYTDEKSSNIHELFIFYRNSNQK